MASPAPPAIGIVKSSHGNAWKLYTFDAGLKARDTLFLLSVGQPKVTCCAIVQGPPSSPPAASPFLSDATDSNRHPVVYDVRIDHPTPIEPISVAVAAQSISPSDRGYRLSTADGASYRVYACLGTEGVNAYLYRPGSRSPEAHLSGYLGYDIESAGGCPQATPPTVQR